ncbi:hypothetical protein MAR_015646 [Mya arenaria]|uniref:Uncharacterized protein n=1 Tax=Mya arenaria TaxID=6604 RepID=A0ABY7FKV3_MYAAR|nr:hypothetical protein MAR_015646 [Mya arenaria]
MAMMIKTMMEGDDDDDVDIDDNTWDEEGDYKKKKEKGGKGLAMGKEGGQHLKYISCSYMTSMCGFEHVNWSENLNLVREKSNISKEKSMGNLYGHLVSKMPLNKEMLKFTLEISKAEIPIKELLE